MQLSRPAACRGRGGRDRDRDARSDGFEESVLNISRVCKVVKGGRHVAFRADVVVGNQRGLVRSSLSPAAPWHLPLPAQLALAPVLLALPRASHDSRALTADCSRALLGKTGPACLLPMARSQHPPPGLPGKGGLS